ncbi:MAG: hypothetical protein J5606_10310 [Bacteroidales bacterium]|nr:hypothetical protein [Bacteroidales bacterium]
MNIQDRINAFRQLGRQLRIFLKEEQNNPNLLHIIDNEQYANSWFTPFFVRHRLQSIAACLTEQQMQIWLKDYKNLPNHQPKTIGVIMAGNLPLVGFHDFLSVLMVGDRLVAKLSSQDKHLLPAIAQMLIAIEPRFEQQIVFTEGRIGHIDKVISTGGSNSAKYFAYYFKNIPSIIRSHCNSVALLDGTETEEDLDHLADDIFLYFGLGCRSVSKIFVPQNYNFEKLFKAMDKYKPQMAQHHKYLNNLEYQKTMHLINMIPFLDQGLLVVKECPDMASPIAVLHYEYYQNKEQTIKNIFSLGDKLQCAVGNNNVHQRLIPFGKAQYPALNDYANDIDTIAFLLKDE